MFRVILKYFGYAILLSIIVTYFIFSTKLSRDGGEKLLCTKLNITILDSAINKFLSEQDVKEIIKEIGIEERQTRISTIDLNRVEDYLSHKTVIKNCEANRTIHGSLNILITQRRPVLRVETEEGGFYIDDTGYVFPLMRAFSSYVPILSGKVPITDQDKIVKFAELGKYIQEDRFWNAQIEHIVIDEKENLVITPRVGDQEILFGPPENIKYKFDKLSAFYKFIIPVEGWEKYSSIDLRYYDQIVCKKRVKKENINKIN